MSITTKDFTQFHGLNFQVEVVSFKVTQLANPFQVIGMTARSERLDSIANILATAYDRPFADEMSFSRLERKKLGDCTQAAVCLMSDLMLVAPITYAHGYRSKMLGADDWHVFNILEDDVVLDASNTAYNPPLLARLDDYIELTGLNGLEVFDFERFTRFAAKGTLRGCPPGDPVLMRMGQRDKKLLKHAMPVKTMAQFAAMTAGMLPVLGTELDEYFGGTT